MKEYRNNNRLDKHKQRKKSQSHVQRGFINLFLLCCCITVLILAIGLISYDFSSATKGYTNTYFSTDTLTNYDLNTALANNLTSDAIQANSNDDAWYLVLVNKWNYIPNDYEVELIELANKQLVDKRIYPALQEMFDAARNDGVYPIVVSGYRTEENQQRLMDEKIAGYIAEGYSAEEAINKAQTWVAIPGTSEHQLGIAVDINADVKYSTSENVYGWLSQNSYKFGFIHRYSADKTDITGIIGEQWHYRYVGIDAATEIYNHGVCLEEYLDKTN